METNSCNDFPFIEISEIAEQESWRKEVYRPLSYIHKWWARRLGSVFRGLLINEFKNPDQDLMDVFYSDTTFTDKIVFDPFMGSGTTITEAIKLGARVIGSDINPVSTIMVQSALCACKIEAVQEAFNYIEKECKEKIVSYYTTSYKGYNAKVLYYFWVKQLHCDNCGCDIPLFKSTIFSKNAYPSKKPMAQSVCPYCGEINQVHYQATKHKCICCEGEYNPQIGNVDKNFMCTCPSCGRKEKIIDYVKRTKRVLPERIYAKMILDSSGTKRYVCSTEEDFALYNQAVDSLPKYEQYIPDDVIEAGYNTDQIITYNYRKWREMFNGRQLLCFGILSKAIMSIKDANVRRLFAVLMSGTLEFNNMFCSFKGEGTGAVRPLFYNHIFKTELTPLEANVWGGKGSSGAFSNLFETRIVRALTYKIKPYELKLVPDRKENEKYYLNGIKIESELATSFIDLDSNRPLILCGDSSQTCLMNSTVDLVLTDPPFFDNVNYSELADFFYVWLRRFNLLNCKLDTTRSNKEVQDQDSEKFTEKLQDVFIECKRVLKKEGHLVFTYHHSRIEGWTSVYNAIMGAGFRIVDVFPVKAEMAVSVAIQSAKVPINYDLVFVCAKEENELYSANEAVLRKEFISALNGIEGSNLKFTIGDKLMYCYGLILKYLSMGGKKEIADNDISEIRNALDLF